jgi:ankyrin repeat protein
MIPPAISRTIDHLEKVVQLAESFRATASTVVDGGSDYRSDVDSVNGVPLGRGQYDKISEWIPVEPIIEEEANSEAPEAMRHEQSELSSKISLRLDDSESEEDLELETRLTGKFATLAIEKYISKNYAGAEMLLRKTLHRYDRQRSKADFSRSILDIRFILAYSCLFQCKLGEAEMIFISLLPLLGNNFQRFFTAMHSLANIYLAKRNLDLAETYSRRAMKGRRRHLGEESDLYYLSVLLFVSICREKGELAEADVYISLISEETWTRLTNSIPSHSSSSESSKAILPRTLELEEHYVHTYFIATPMSKGINENKTHSDLAVADSMLRHIAIRESPPMVVGNDHNDVVNSTISQRDLSEEGHILQKLDLIDHLSASKDDAKIEQAVDEAVQLLKRCFPNENFRMDGKDFCIENFKQLIRQSEGKGMVARQHWRKRGHGALYLCALRNCTILARILLERGADLNERFHCEQGNAGHHLGFKALDFPLGLTTLELAAGAGSEAMVRLCIEKGAVYTAQADSCSALYHAAECGRVGVMELLLSLPGQNVDERNPFGTSLLEIAVRNGHANAVEHLLKKNAQKLPSALSIAAQWGHKDVIRVLTRQGYDINKVHSNGETLLYRAVASEQNDFAIQLLECGADPDARGGMPLTPLFLAVTNEDLELVRALLDHGANPMASGFRRMHTPLNDARDPIIADELMKYGATIRTRPNLSRGAV